MKANIFFLIFVLIFFSYCSSNDKMNISTDENSGTVVVYDDWGVPINEVVDGGPGKDGIPSIDFPVFLDAENEKVNSYMNDEDLVVGIVNGEVSKAYPHRILDWHEVVNDDISGEKITISYCPLTGTAFGWKSSVGNSYSDFGVSGLLYNNNLILYDRKSNSYWSQLRLECINGEYLNDKPEVINVIETTWKLWKEMFPNTKILSDNQGINRDYSVYPYGTYREDDEFLLFPISKTDNTLPNKERVHLIISENSVKVFEFSNFETGKAIKTNFLSESILVIGDKKMINSYVIEGQYSDLVFEYDFSSPNYYFKDNEGNKWNVLGEVVDGPRKGESLKPTNSLMSYWFAIPAFFKEIDIFE